MSFFYVSLYALLFFLESLEYLTRIITLLWVLSSVVFHLLVGEGEAAASATSSLFGSRPVSRDRATGRQASTRGQVPPGNDSPDVEFIEERQGSSIHHQHEGVRVRDLTIGYDNCVTKAGLADHVVPSLTAYALEARESLLEDLCRRVSAYGCTGTPMSK
jgi:hypothetical protein